MVIDLPRVKANLDLARTLLGAQHDLGNSVLPDALKYAEEAVAGLKFAVARINELKSQTQKKLTDNCPAVDKRNDEGYL